MTLQAQLTAAQHLLAHTLNLDNRTARLEARLLLQRALNVDHAWLISHADDACEGKLPADFQAMLTRRLAGEPVAYILGRREFFGLNLQVTTDTLIPRPDTETLVEAALRHIPAHAACQVLDLGTGTGAIALAIASRRPQAEIMAVDFSAAALQVAVNNARQLDIQSIQFRHSNWFDNLSGQAFDIIVSNPPYIAAEDAHLTQGDLRFEPSSALVSGHDGLDAIRHIVASAPQYLKQNGWLLLEHGYDQASPVADLMQQHFIAIEHVKDLAQISRVTLGQLGQQPVMHSGFAG